MTDGLNSESFMTDGLMTESATTKSPMTSPRQWVTSACGKLAELGGDCVFHWYFPIARKIIRYLVPQPIFPQSVRSRHSKLQNLVWNYQAVMVVIVCICWCSIGFSTGIVDFWTLFYNWDHFGDSGIVENVWECWTETEKPAVEGMERTVDWHHVGHLCQRGSAISLFYRQDLF